jgi:hypothetical protein
MRSFAAAVAAVGLLLAPSFAIAQGKGKGKGHGKGHDKEAAGRSSRPLDPGIISGYYRSNGLPPGLAKRNGDLPPGLQKQLRRNGHLPPGLEKKLAPFPMEIESRLPPCPPDVRRGIVGGMAVMYNSRTGLVLDAFVLAGR